MPAKNSIGKFHGRHPFIEKKLWKKYVKQTENPVSYEEFKLIIAASLQELQSWVLKDPIGFQFSPKLGRIAINKFKMYEGFKTFIHKKGIGRIQNHNLHSDEHAFKIQWFHSQTSHKSRMPYWFFRAERSFNRDLARVLKGGKAPEFNSFMQDHFVQKLPS